MRRRTRDDAMVERVAAGIVVFMIVAALLVWVLL